MLFAYFAKIDVVTTASGIAKPIGEVYRVQMPKTSTIIAMNVKEGTKVKEGTTLFALADEQIIEVDNQTNEKLLKQAQLEKKALAALFAGQPLAQHLTPEVISDNPEVKAYYTSLLSTMEATVRVLESERAQQERTTALYEQQKQSLQAEISNAQAQSTYLKERKNQTSAQAELAQLERQLKTAQEAEAEYQKKYAENENYKSVWESKKSERESKEAQIEVKQAQMAETDIELNSQISSYQSTIAKLTADLAIQEENKNLVQAKVAELDLQIASVQAEEKNKLSTLILDKTKEIKQYQASLEKGQQFVQEQTVAAPISGIVGEILTDEFGQTLPKPNKC
ncbi:hypothetical protein ACSFB8_08705 [Enterococcus faecalis]